MIRPFLQFAFWREILASLKTLFGLHACLAHLTEAEPPRIERYLEAEWASCMLQVHVKPTREKYSYKTRASAGEPGFYTESGD